jgi:AmpD protein
MMCVMRSHRTASIGSGPLAVDVGTGLLQGTRQVASPNCDDRPAGVQPELIVVHGISLPPGEYGGPHIDQLFTNRLSREAHPYFEKVADLRVSAHLMVRRDGEVVQYVPCHRRAWHAGASSWRGRERCNDFSIGIEVEGSDGEPYESTQYAMLARVIALLCRAYASLSLDQVVGHSDIAPGRKTDPGPAFDWPRLRALARFEWEVAPP